jgi:hypothetical protein
VTEPSDNTPPENTPPRKRWFAQWWIPFAAGLLTGLVLRIVFFGKTEQAYDAMMGSFTLLVPVAVAAVTVYVAELTQRRNWTYYFLASAAANVLFVLGTVLVMVEGVICAILALPLFAVMGGLAGLLVGVVVRWAMWPKQTVYSLMALPLLLGGVEQHIPLPNAIQTAERSIVIPASPEQIWPHLLTAQEIETREMGDGLMYRIGVPLPLSATTERNGDELVRHIRMGKAVHFDQVATDWQEARYVRWENRFAADSFPAGALDDHVRIGGHHFDAMDAEYRLKEVPGGTELHVTMHYRVSTHFNWYARPLADLLIDNFERTALEFYAHRTMATAAAAPVTSSR